MSKPASTLDEIDHRTPVTVLITCMIKKGMLDHAARAIGAIGKIVMAEEPACTGIQVHIESQNPHRLMIIEHWQSEDIFKGPHMQQPHMKEFMESAVEFVDGPPAFSFWREIPGASSSPDH